MLAIGQVVNPVLRIHMKKASAFALLCAIPLLGQNTGRLSGKVEDITGSAIPEASVDIALPGSITPIYSARTSAAGYYNFIGLRAGQYDLNVQAPGFQNYGARRIDIDPGRELTLSAIKMTISGVAESINVVAEAPGVQTGNAEISNTVTMEQIRSLPVLDRQVLALIQTQAGVSFSRGPTAINGLRTSTSSVTLDGINIQDNFARRTGLDFVANRPSVDQVVEFTIITSNANATVGGGVSQVIMVTPSGGNEFHGNAYWYNRNSKFSANSWFNNKDNIPNPFLNQNQIGGTLGGPIIRNKLLFFGGYEVLRSRQQTSLTRRILTEDARNGIFTYTDGAVTRKVNVLQAAGVSMDPAMKAILDQVPGPDKINNFRTGDSSAALLRNTAGYSFLARNNRTRDNVTSKLDYLISTRHVLTGTYLWNNEFVDRSDAQNDLGANTNGFGALPLVYTDASRNLASLTWRWNPSPRFTNELRGGFNYSPSNFLGSDLATKNQYVITLFSNPQTNFLPNGRDTRTYHLQDTASYTQGRHSVQFGFNGQQLRVRVYDDAGTIPSYTLGLGAGNPGLSSAALPGAGSTDVAAANNLLASLAGYVTSFTQTFNVRDRTSGYVPGSNIQHMRWMSYAFFVQDTWKIRPRVTLNLGVRWEPFLPVDERDSLALLPVLVNNNPIETFRTNATLDFAGSSVGRPWYKSDYNNFAPNVGLAWDVFGDGKASVRAGYSVSFINDNAIQVMRNNVLVTNKGLSTVSARSAFSGTASAGLPAVPIPVFKIPSTFADQYANNRSVAFGMPDPNLATPYVQQWNLSIQKEIKGNVVEIRYLGNKGTKLYRGIDFNQVDINAGGFLQDFMRAYNNGNLARVAGKGFDPIYNPSIPGSQQLTVFPRLGGSISGTSGAAYRNLIQRGEVGELAFNYQRDNFNGPINFFRNPVSLGTNLMTNFSNSSYQSLQVEMTRRFRTGFQFQANYVYGKVLSDSGSESDDQFEALLDVNNAKIERARATFDLTHTFKANGIWELPFGQGHWIDYKPLERVIGGWTLGGTTIWQSGAPFSILSQRATLNRTSRSFVNTANTNQTKGQLDELMGLRFTGDGPFFIAQSAISPTEGRGAASDGSPAFGGQVFFNPGPGTLGSLQRRMFSGPSAFNIDLAVVKRVKIAERQSIDIRMDALNALNHPNFIIGDQLLDSSSFGRVTTGFFDRRIVQFALRYSF
jgi:hypothetical protein